MKFIDLKTSVGAGALREVLRRAADGSPVSHLPAVAEAHLNARSSPMQSGGALKADATTGRFGPSAEWNPNSPTLQSLAADAAARGEQLPQANSEIPIFVWDSAAGLPPVKPTELTRTRQSEMMTAIAERAGDSNMFASRGQVRLEKAASQAQAAAALQGRDVRYTVDPEVSAFFTILSADNAKSLKALTDALVSPKLAEHTESGQFTLAMSPTFTERQRTAMFEALKLGGSPQTLDAKLNPLELRPFSGT